MWNKHPQPQIVPVKHCIVFKGSAIPALGSPFNSGCFSTIFLAVAFVAIGPDSIFSLLDSSK